MATRSPFVAADGRRIEDRRTAGAHLLSRLRLIERGRTRTELGLGTLGGFELACVAGPTWRRDFEARLILRRTGLDQEIETEHDLTPMGLVARIEHILERMKQDRQEQERCAAEADGRLLGYRDRVGQPFALQPELDSKKAELAALEADLAATAKPPLAKAA